MRTFYERDLVAVEGGWSSKGAQLKFTSIEGYWIKVDTYGYEGLAEVLVSRFLANMGVRSVLYVPCRVVMQHGKVAIGCYSENFIGSSNAEHSLYSLLYAKDPLFERSWRGWSVSQKWEFCVQALGGLIPYNELLAYMTQLVIIDRITYNTDRHLGNILFIEDTIGERLYPAPVFDNGSALFSRTVDDFPMDYDLVKCRKRARARPFSTSFEKQANFFQQVSGMVIAPQKVFVSREGLDAYTPGEVSRACKALKYGAKLYDIEVIFE